MSNSQIVKLVFEYFECLGFGVFEYFGVFERSCVRWRFYSRGVWVLGRRERLGGLEGSHPRYLTHFNKEEKSRSIILEVGKRHCIAY